ncbi:MAG: sigma 54-interacting transcriptional regulator [Candidatus Latescibacteria bacterium]|nr:sigma 54-interacting transcriptional regulator [Candidatus Latescibacterota bacterium]
MRVDELKISELVEFDSEGGLVRFANQRALIFDATAKGTLSKELVDNFGASTARAVLTRFGYVQGWRMAAATQELFQWESEADWQEACGRIHMLGGMYHMGAGTPGCLTKDGLSVVGSYEAEQYLAHSGKSDTPVCWTISGIMSGYLSRSMDKEIYVFEEHCVACGDTTCHFLARTLEEWGDERAEELRFYHVENLKEWLEPSLHRITEDLKETERKLSAKRRTLARVVPDAVDPIGVVARSPAMRRVVDLARRIAKVDSTVLITGESGTGKELISQLVHEKSSRASRPFIAVNCGAITESLLESELFGHARGSFTGAVQERPGLFEAANGGTVLLDEIGDVSPGMQVKLLRVLQEREIRRVGENKSRPVNVRVIAATNRELAADIAEGRFRKDLYYRLNVVQVHVPALRDRREDILPLARILLADAAKRMKRPVTGFAPRAADQLLRYDWPGNVRELENAIERAIALGNTNLVVYDDLPEEVRQAVPIPSVTGPVRELEEIEKDYILAVLDLNDGNQTRTAKQLGIGSATLSRKLRSWGVGRDTRKATGDDSAAD